MILIYILERLRLALDVSLFLVLCIILLGLSKGNPRMLLSGYPTKVSILSTFCNKAIQKFNDSWEVLRVPIHANYVVVFEICLELNVPHFSALLSIMRISYPSLALMLS